MLLSFVEGASRGRVVAVRLADGAATDVAPSGGRTAQRLTDVDGDGTYELEGSIRAFVPGRGPENDVTSRLEWQWDGTAYLPVRCDLTTGGTVVRRLDLDDPVCADPALAPEAAS